MGGWVLWYPLKFHPWCINPDSKVYGANMGPTWVLSAPDGPHVGPMNFAIRESIKWDDGVYICSVRLLSTRWQWSERQRLRRWRGVDLVIGGYIICRTMVILTCLGDICQTGKIYRETDCNKIGMSMCTLNWKIGIYNIIDCLTSNLPQPLTESTPTCSHNFELQAKHIDSWVRNNDICCIWFIYSNTWAWICVYGMLNWFILAHILTNNKRWNFRLIIKQLRS